MKTKNTILLLLFFLLPAVPASSQTAGYETEHELKLSSGCVKRYFIPSTQVDGRKVDVWLPDDYAPDKKYAVLYLHDGQNLFDSTRVWNAKEWQVDEHMGRLLAEKAIQPTIVVGIWNNGNKRHVEYFPEKAIPYIKEPQYSLLLSLMPEGALADRYLRFIVNELKPFIDQRFPTHADAAHTFMAGSSMGGLISLYALCEYPEVFGGVACLSTHWIGTLDYNKEIPEGIDRYVQENLPDPNTRRVYFDYGTRGLDANYPEFQAIIDRSMSQKGYDGRSWKTLRFENDGHNETYWSKRLRQPLLFLLQDAATPLKQR